LGSNLGRAELALGMARHVGQNHDAVVGQLAQSDHRLAPPKNLSPQRGLKRSHFQDQCAHRGWKVNPESGEKSGDFRMLRVV
jgi:hypothetical protein